MKVNETNPIKEVKKDFLDKSTNKSQSLLSKLDITSYNTIIIPKALLSAYANSDIWMPESLNLKEDSNQNDERHDTYGHVNGSGNGLAYTYSKQENNNEEV